MFIINLQKWNFQKLMKQNEELAGATIQIIEKETGEIIEEWVSTRETHIIPLS